MLPPRKVQVAGLALLMAVGSGAGASSAAAHWSSNSALMTEADSASDLENLTGEPISGHNGTFVWQLAELAEFTFSREVGMPVNMLSVSNAGVEVGYVAAVGYGASGTEDLTLEVRGAEAVAKTSDVGILEAGLVFEGVDEDETPAGDVDALGVHVSIPPWYVYNPTWKYGPEYKAQHDYCTFSPDKPGIKGISRVDFRGSCARHDLCYELYNGRADKISKRDENCQVPFRNRMKTECNRTFPGKGSSQKYLRVNCRILAQGYYVAVKAYNKKGQYV